ncbi:MAG: SCO family protein [Paraglaciecola sp.]|nr:SCO family protein [Paraglaciecola sp.]NCT49705.1 SCO family protein [Paraglaciecola sp.]
MNKLQTGLLACIALVVGIYFALTIAPTQNQQAEYLSAYPAPRALPDFALIDQRQQPFTSEQLQGHWTLVFVGYTYCPDICPTTLAELQRIYPELQTLPTKNTVQVVFVSVDPKRDTPERLLEYINFFEPSFYAVSGEHKELYPLVRAMGMMYSMVDDTDEPNYLVDHSASVVLINPSAQVVGRFKAEFAPSKLGLSNSQKILSDMKIISAD